MMGGVEGSPDSMILSDHSHGQIFYFEEKLVLSKRYWHTTLLLYSNTLFNFNFNTMGILSGHAELDSNKAELDSNKPLEITIGDNKQSIIAPERVTKEQIIDAIHWLIPVEEKLVKKREQKIQTAVKALNDKIEEEWPINTLQRKKRWKLIAKRIKIDDQYCTWIFESYWKQMSFKINVKNIDEWDIEIWSTIYTIEVNKKKYTVSLSDINIIHAAMTFLVENGSRDYDNPFQYSIGGPGQPDQIFLKEKLTLTNPKGILRAGKGWLKFLSWQKSHLRVKDLTKILNEKALQERILDKR